MRRLTGRGFLAPAAVGVAGSLLAVGCSAGTDVGTGPGPGGEGSAASGNVEEFGHVHGLGVNPADESLYVATHLGVFKETDTGFERIADRWQDTMAFTVVGPDHFLGSGHPDLREDRPPHLGLIESTDAAETWESLSLEGEADFHVLEPAGDRLYAYDAVTGTLLATEDRQEWSSVITAPLFDVEADPEDVESLVLTDQRGTVMRLRVGEQPRAVPDSPRLGILDWPAPDRLVGLGAAGEVWSSSDRGESWERLGAVPGAPQAFTAGGEDWYAATEQGLYRSTDGGTSWEPYEKGA